VNRRTVSDCDRCRKPGVFALDLEVGVEPDGDTERVTMQPLDLCVRCAAHALRLLTEGMGYAAKLAWIAQVTTPPDAAKESRG
jgi:hypothetical protein